MEETKNNRDWTNEYFNLLLKNDSIYSLQLKKEHFPKTFFKYRRLNQNTLEPLKQKYFYLRSITTLNDPFESTLRINVNETFRSMFSDLGFLNKFEKMFKRELSAEEINMLTKHPNPLQAFYDLTKSLGLIYNAEKKMEDIQYTVTKKIEDFSKNIKINSFSERNDSLLMWSHYADEHKGICIEYELSSQENSEFSIEPIIYSDSIFTIETLDKLTELKKSIPSLFKCKVEQKGPQRFTKQVTREP